MPFKKFILKTLIIWPPGLLKLYYYYLVLNLLFQPPSRNPKSRCDQ